MSTNAGDRHNDCTKIAICEITQNHRSSIAPRVKPTNETQSINQQKG
jgi:hypothetical protein